jgi:hypothetical protein
MSAGAVELHNAVRSDPLKARSVPALAVLDALAAQVTAHTMSVPAAAPFDEYAKVAPGMANSAAV